MHKQPLLIMLVCFIAGIFLCDFFYFTPNQIIITLFFGISLITVSIFKIQFFFNFRNCFLGFLFFSIGIFSHYLNSGKPEIPNFTGSQKVLFQLDKKLNSNKKYKRYQVLATVSIDKKPFDFNLVVSIPKDQKSLDFQHYYQAETYINKVEAPKNDFQFNYAKYLERKGVYFQGFVNNGITEVPKKNLSILEIIKQKRLDILSNIDSSSLQIRKKEFLKGIILADRTEIDSEMVQDFSKSGLVHFLAISGTHLAIIFWLILFLLKPIFPAQYRQVPIFISLVLLWSFTIFIDFGSSVVRSCLMISAYYCFVLLQRKPDLLHAVAIAGFVILIFDTQQVFDVGFQLSFIAVLGIFWLNDAVCKHLPKPKNKIQNFLLNIISVSLSAQIVTLPLVIFYFHQYSFLSIIANLVIVPFSEIIIIFSLIVTVLFAFKIEFSWLDFFYDSIIDLLLKSIHFFASQDWFFIKNIPLNIPEVIILFVMVFLLKNVLRKENKTIVNFFEVLILFVLVRTFVDFYQFQKSEVLIVKYFNENIIIQKERDKAIFWVGEDTDVDYVKRFLVAPYMVSRRVEKYELKKISKNLKIIKIDNKVIR